MQSHYVQIPKDLNDIKQKFMFGMTKRQVVSFGIGFILGIPIFFLTRGALGLSGAIIAMGCCAAPAIVCGVYKKNGIFFEQQIRNMAAYFRSPRVRTYRNVTAFSCIERNIEYIRLKRLLAKAEKGKGG